MNILLLTPGMNKNFNDNYHAYSYMAKAGNNILAITHRQNINKGDRLEILPQLEIDGRFIIHRLFDTWRQQKSLLGTDDKYARIKKILLEFKPNVIFCEDLSNMKLAVEIKRNLNIPIVLRVEYIYDKEHPYRTMGRTLKYFRNGLSKDHLPIIIGSFIWNWVCKNSDAIISCYFEDASKKITDFNNLFYYVPWPTFYPESAANCIKVNNRAVFIGSFDNHKNLIEFASTVPLLFQGTPIQELYIVGTGEDRYIVDSLKVAYPDKIKHITFLNRGECLELIRSSYISYSPATSGGWGFIGDSWAMKTPVVVTSNHYGFQDGVDSIVTTPDKMVDRVNELYKSNELYSIISSGGYDRFVRNHAAEGVGQKYIDICSMVIS